MSETAATPAQETPNAGEGSKVEAGSAPKAQVETKESSPQSESAPKDAAPATEQKPNAEAPAAQKTIVPEKYDLKLPEGSQLDGSVVERIAAEAKQQGLSNEQAQAILERENKAVATFVEGQKSQMQVKVEAWKNEVQVDKELGGNELPKNLEHAKRVVDKYASPAFKQILNETGLGNHPELVRVFARIGKEMAEDSLVLPGTSGTGKQSIEERLWGSQEKGN
jgi:hypothetical protein